MPGPAYDAQSDRGAQTMRFPPVCRHRPQSLIGLLPRADNAEAVSCPSSEAGILPTEVYFPAEIPRSCPRAGSAGTKNDVKGSGLAGPPFGESLEPYLAPYGYHAVNEGKLGVAFGQDCGLGVTIKGKSKNCPPMALAALTKPKLLLR
jgi:hypothetical protein